eukprot:22376-Pelagococcus_subviridis.AAC.4
MDGVTSRHITRTNERTNESFLTWLVVFLRVATRPRLYYLVRSYERPPPRPLSSGVQSSSSSTKRPVDRLVVLVDRHVPELPDGRDVIADATEDGVLPVQPRRRREHPPARVLQLARDLVLELPAPDGRPAAPRPGRVPALDHEVFDDAVEHDAVVVARARELDEVLARLRAVEVVQLDRDRSDVRVERHLGRGLPLRRRRGLLVLWRRHRVVPRARASDEATGRAPGGCKLMMNAPSAVGRKKSRTTG